MDFPLQGKCRCHVQLGPILGGALAMWFGIKFVVFFSGFVLLPLVIFLYLRRPKEETSTKGNEAKLG